jgi:acyl carrier protein phosphodiesterase
MNFFGHAVVSLWHSDDRHFVLGAMLPDLCAMLGLRLAPVDHEAIAAGVDFHHRTDAAFHGCERFVGLCTQTVERLTARGVGRGTSRAVAHVGTELLLDGLLSEESSSRATYTDVLMLAIEERLSAALPAPPEAQDRLHRGLTRLRQAPIPEAYLDPTFVGDRLQAMLAPRPRLAFQPGDLVEVTQELRSLSSEVASSWREILAQVRGRLDLEKRERSNP